MAGAIKVQRWLRTAETSIRSKRDYELRGSVPAIWRSSQIGDDCGHNVVSRGLGSGVAICLHTGGQQTQDSDEAKASDTYRKRDLNERKPRDERSVLHRR